MDKRPLSKKRRRWRLGVLLILLAVAIYATVIEPRWVEVHRLDIPLQRLPRAFDGLKVAHLTDIHYLDGLERGYFQRVVAMTNRLHPDVIVLTGDYVTRSSDDFTQCARMLSELRAPLGVYAVLGNHDFNFGLLPVIKALKSAGITVLINTAVPLKRDNARLWLVGLDNVSCGCPSLPQALRAVPANDVTILLVHEPDYADIAARFPIDLQLSGHSHGGMVWLPLIGAPHVPWGAKKYPRELRRIGSLTEYTGRGVGGLPIFGLPVRLNARPEIAVITLRAGHN